MGLPAGWIARMRRFSEGKGLVVVPSFLTLIFFLILCANVGLYYYHPHSSRRSPELTR